MSELQPIVSSNLEAAGYDAKKRELTVRFKGESTFRYFKVMPGLWKKFENTFDGTKGSAGKFHAAYIKGLDCEKIDSEG